MSSRISSAIIPTKDLLLDSQGFVSGPWMSFFTDIYDSLKTLGNEKTFQLENNLTSSKALEGMAFSSDNVSQAVIDFCIQRITTGTGAVEIVASGTIHAVYLPTSDNWVLVSMGTPGPGTSGITLSITNKGQVIYTSSNIAGTPSISRIFWKARTLAGKSSKYSKVGK